MNRTGCYPELFSLARRNRDSATAAGHQTYRFCSSDCTRMLVVPEIQCTPSEYTFPHYSASFDILNVFYYMLIY